jgi:prefoldin subunit 5
MQNSRSHNSAVDLRRQLQELQAQQRQLRQRIEQIDQVLANLEAVQQARREAVQTMRSSVVYCGDIVSPADDTWDVEQ